MRWGSSRTLKISYKLATRRYVSRVGRLFLSRWPIVQHAPAPFKIAELARWTVYLSNRTHLEELSRAADDEFSFLEGIHDVRHAFHAADMRLTYRMASTATPDQVHRRP